GHIYSAQDLRKLNLEKRPNFEWNLFLPIILSIVGNFKGQVPGLEFTGISPLDQQGADLHQTLSNYFLTQANDVEYELSKAFLWAVVGRIGWLKTSWSLKTLTEW
ncbi:MAG: portal protein, partial [Nitrospiria bacterium]